MEEKQENNKLKRNKIFVLCAFALILLLLILSIAEIISINAINKKMQNQAKEIDRMTNELNYYKNKAETQTDDEIYEGVIS